MENTEVYPLFTEIKLKRAKVEGIITCVCVRHNVISYEMQFYNDSQERKCIWVEEWEFEVVSQKQKLGFKQ